MTQINQLCKHKHPEPRFSGDIEKLQAIPSFNLTPVRTCPGRTKACVEYCYACKGRFLYRDVKAMYNANHIASRCDCFVDRINSMLDFTMRAFRIHASGDFYSTEYFMKWVQIALDNPTIMFMAYTRNYLLDLRDLPPNLIIYYSTDHTTKIVNPTAERFASVVHVEKSTIPHMKSYKDGVFCTSEDCSKCGYCWLTRENVYFPQRYKKYIIPELKVIL